MSMSPVPSGLDGYSTESLFSEQFKQFAVGFVVYRKCIVHVKKAQCGGTFTADVYTYYFLMSEH